MTSPDEDAVKEILTRISPKNLLALGSADFDDKIRPLIVASGVGAADPVLQIIAANYAAGYSNGWAQSQGSFLEALLAAGYWVTKQ